MKLNFFFIQIEIQRRKDEPVPLGWAQDTSGKMTTDANVAFSSCCLMPLGGPEITSGYKGYGLGAMVEICCGVMAGANYSTKVRSWTHAGTDTEANLGQCFIALDPNCFSPDFSGDLSEMLNILKNLAPVSTMIFS